METNSSRFSDLRTSVYTKKNFNPLLEEFAMIAFLKTIALFLILILFIWGLLNAYLFIFRNSNRGCPRCRRQLYRIKRSEAERRLAYAFPRLRRFTCRKCRWEGLLVQPRSFKQPESPEF